MDLNQIYAVSQDDPNTPNKVVPMNQQTTNLFVSKTKNSLWNWDIFTLTWEFVMQFVNPIMQGVGSPTAPPPDPQQPTMYYNVSGGQIYNWVVSTQTWQ